jgi:hypothetical protein
LTADEIAAISKSLQEFQAGESSEGKHLFEYAREYAHRSGDTEYIPAMRLFIAEEQRHSRDLGRFLKLNSIPVVRTTFADQVFRRLRNIFGGLEISIAVLITAEIIAEIYYAALRDATKSTILRRLCDQILSDEVRHVQFQSEQLARLRSGRNWIGLTCTIAMQRFLFLGTIGYVWLSHRRAIRRGGMSFDGWWKACWGSFNQAFAHPYATMPLIPLAE